MSWSEQLHVWLFTNTFPRVLGDNLCVLAWYQTHAESISTDTAGARQYKNYCSISAAAASGTFEKRLELFKGLCCISFSSKLRHETLSYRSSLRWCNIYSENSYTYCLLKNFWLNNSTEVTNSNAYLEDFHIFALWSLDWKTPILGNYISPFLLDNTGVKNLCERIIFWHKKLSILMFSNAKKKKKINLHDLVKSSCYSFIF